MGRDHKTEKARAMTRAFSFLDRPLLFACRRLPPFTHEAVELLLVLRLFQAIEEFTKGALLFGKLAALCLEPLDFAGFVGVVGTVDAFSGVVIVYSHDR